MRPIVRWWFYLKDLRWEVKIWSTHKNRSWKCLNKFEKSSEMTIPYVYVVVCCGNSAEVNKLPIRVECSVSMKFTFLNIILCFISSFVGEFSDIVDFRCASLLSRNKTEIYSTIPPINSTTNRVFWCWKSQTINRPATKAAAEKWKCCYFSL